MMLKTIFVRIFKLDLTALSKYFKLLVYKLAVLVLQAHFDLIPVFHVYIWYAYAFDMTNNDKIFYTVSQGHAVLTHGMSALQQLFNKAVL